MAQQRIAGISDYKGLIQKAQADLHTIKSSLHSLGEFAGNNGMASIRNEYRDAIISLQNVIVYAQQEIIELGRTC